MEPQTGIANSPDRNQVHTHGCLIIFGIVVVIVQGLVILGIGSGWWPRDDLVYCLISLVTVLITIAIIVITITKHNQNQSVRNRFGMISLLMGGLGCVAWLLYYVLSRDPSIPLADFFDVNQLTGQLCMPMVCLAFGLGGWRLLSYKPGRMWGYLLFFLGLALLLWNECAMVAYGLT